MKNNCSICQNNKTKILFVNRDPKSKKKYTYNQCASCLTIEIFPKIQPEEIQAIYCHKNIHGDFLQNNEQFKFLGFIPFLNSLFNFYLGTILKNRKNTVLKIEKEGSLLDIGFGGANFLKSFDKKNWELWGIEINQDLVQTAKKRLPNANLKNTDIKNSNFPKNYFDVITLWHVLEHLKYPNAEIEKIKKALKKNGHTIIEVPSADSLYIDMFGKNWQQLITPEHQFFFSEKSLKLILQKHKFKILKVRHLGLTPFSASSSFANFLKSKRVNHTVALIIAISTYPIFLLLNLVLISRRENLQVIATK